VLKRPSRGAARLLDCAATLRQRNR
jgi:hypothetical protein